MSTSMRKNLVVPLVLAVLVVTFAGIAIIKTKTSKSDANQPTEESARTNAPPLPDALQELSDQCDENNILACYQLATQLVIDELVPVDVDRARPLFEKACRADHIPACTDLGYSYENGQNGAEPDYDMADKWYKIACDAGDDHACASMIREGSDEERETLENAFNRLTEACDADNFLACIELGAFYTLGQGVPEDRSFAYNLYTKACEGGAMLGCYYLGSVYAEGSGVTQDIKQAHHYYEMACTGGEISACNNLASLLDQRARKNPADPSSAKDIARARKLYEQSCDAENTAGCHNLAVMLQEGRGAPIDLERAHELFSSACEQGEGAACHSLAILFANDETSTEDDSPRTFKLYQQGCEFDFAPACHNLGMMYATGQTESGEPDFESARTALANACEAKHYPACYFLALLFQNGQGGEVDEQFAAELMKTACDGGESNACDAL